MTAEVIRPDQRTLAGRLRDNLLSTSAAQICERVVSATSAVYLARTLGPAGLGVLGFAAAIAGYASLIASAGLEVHGARLVARGQNEIGRYVGSVIALRSCLALATLSLVVVGIHFADQPQVVKTTVIIAASVICAQPFTLDWVFQGLERMEVIAVRNIATQILNLVGVLILVRSPSRIAVAAIPPVFAAAVNAVWMLGAVKRILPIHVSVNISEWMGMLRLASPILLSTLLFQCYQQFDVFWVYTTRTDTEAGLYAAAWRLSMTLAAVQTLVNQSVYPVLCRLCKSGSDDLTSFLTDATYLMSRVSLLVCGAVILTAPWLVPFIYGQRFLETGKLLQVLAISQILVFNESITAPFLYASGESRRYLIAVGWGAAVNVVPDLFLIPKFGPWAASWVMVATEIVVFSLMLLHSRRIVAFRTRQMLVLPFAIGLGSLYVLTAGHRYIPALCGGVVLGAFLLTSIPSMREAIRRISLLGTDRQLSTDPRA